MADKKPKRIIKDTGTKLIVIDADTGEVLKIKNKDVVTQHPSSPLSRKKNKTSKDDDIF